jgi:hypothetical protein
LDLRICGETYGGSSPPFRTSLIERYRCSTATTVEPPLIYLCNQRRRCNLNPWLISDPLSINSNRNGTVSPPNSIRSPELWLPSKAAERSGGANCRQRASPASAQHRKLAGQSGDRRTRSTNPRCQNDARQLVTRPYQTETERHSGNLLRGLPLSAFAQLRKTANWTWDLAGKHMGFESPVAPANCIDYFPAIFYRLQACTRTRKNIARNRTSLSASACLPGRARPACSKLPGVQAPTQSAVRRPKGTPDAHAPV